MAAAASYGPAPCLPERVLGGGTDTPSIHSSTGTLSPDDSPCVAPVAMPLPDSALLDSMVDDLRRVLSDQSNLWPISEIPAPPRPCSRSSRVVQRWSSALAVWEVAERCRRALNDLKGTLSDSSLGDSSYVARHVVAGRVRRTLGVTSTMHEVHLRLLRRAQFLVRARRSGTGVAWEAELCKHASSAYERDPTERYVPFDASLVSEPDPKHPAIPLLSVLPADLASLYADRDRLVPDLDEKTELLRSLNRQFNRVLGPTVEYHKYLARPDVRCLWELRPATEAVATCSLATVPKRSGDALRKITMVCPFNDVALDVSSLLGRDPAYGLLGAAALSQLHTSSSSVYTAAIDETNAFTFLEVPASWWPFQSGPRVRARDLPQDWVRGRWPGSTWLRPQYRRLAMGFTHAVFLLMAVNFAAVDIG